MNLNRCVGLTAALMMLLNGTSILRGQQTSNPVITGTVQDQTGAAFPGA